MSGPAEPSAGRAVKANHDPLAEYAAAWPTTITSWAISTVPSPDGDGEMSTEGLPLGTADPTTAGEPDGCDDGVELGDATGVAVGLAVGEAGADGGALATDGDGPADASGAGS